METGYTCTVASPSVCTETCGDGLDFKTYECDDGNTIDYDGCDSKCNLEGKNLILYYTIAPGFICNGGSPDRADECEEICGDGLDYHNWGCDDGNKVSL